MSAWKGQLLRHPPEQLTLFGSLGLNPNPDAALQTIPIPVVVGPVGAEKMLASEKSRQRQLRLLDGVAKAFGWDSGGESYDARLFPSQEWQQSCQLAWREAKIAVGPKGNQQLVTPREKVMHRLYDETTWGNHNWDRLRRNDPAIMRMVDAMVEEYSLCFYWDRLAAEEYRLSTPQDRETLRNRTEAVEDVRQQVGAHYAETLKEQGYSYGEIKKIIGAGVAGYLQTCDALGLIPSPVYPNKTDDPKEMYDLLVNAGQNSAQRRGIYI